jgi:cysteine-rich repeat protein
LAREMLKRTATRKKPAPERGGFQELAMKRSFLIGASFLLFGACQLTIGNGREGRLNPEDCGDGLVQLGEECDDMNDVPGDGCENDCSRSRTVCGNAILEPGEICDDGNTASGDGCRRDCAKVELCGDGVLDSAPEGGEVCDDGEAASGDGCRSDCKGFEQCGDGFWDVFEVCDDGNTASGDGCSSSCDSVETCGDGYLDEDEECDDGNNDDADGCDSNCTLPGCGNGIVAEGELCFAPKKIVQLATGGSNLREAQRVDVDQDGDLDVVVLRMLSFEILLNDGAGNLTPVTPLTMYGLMANELTAADLDQDGDVDLAISVLDASGVGYILLFSNNGTGGFLYMGYHWLSVPPYSIVSGDFDNDGKIDLVTGNSAGGASPSTATSAASHSLLRRCFRR